MKVIIPFKFNSSRCAKKNVREFFNGKSLLDITVENFLKYNHDVYLLCVDAPQTKELIRRHKVNHIPLNNTSNNWSEVVIWTTRANLSMAVYHPTILAVQQHPRLFVFCRRKARAIRISSSGV